jgi:predicted ATP-dependent serine protease
VEHHVDATFILRRLENHTRVLECKKNRFGPANLRAFLRMGPQGLRVVEEETGASPKGDHTL